MNIYVLSNKKFKNEINISQLIFLSKDLDLVVNNLFNEIKKSYQKGCVKKYYYNNVMVCFANENYSEIFDITIYDDESGKVISEEIELEKVRNVIKSKDRTDYV